MGFHRRKLRDHLPIGISIVALLGSFYSIWLTQESQVFHESQSTLRGSNELLLLLQKEDQLNGIEFDGLLEIVGYVNRNELSEDQREYLRKIVDERFEQRKASQVENLKTWEEVLDSRGRERNIHWLTATIGLYHLRISSLEETIQGDRELLKLLEVSVADSVEESHQEPGSLE